MLSSEALSGFKGGLKGQLIRPEDDGYDVARKVWNGVIDKKPALIVRCAGVSDVLRAVKFARANGLPVAVRGGGHNVAGNAVCDGGLVVDMSLMKSIRVDPVSRTARAEGGATWNDLDHEAQSFDLATTGGIVSTTGIAGLTLGGGIGWLAREHGLACDNLLSADLVTASGELVKANSAENPDLFWGVRGGGGNFGIATSLEYKLHSVGQVLAGLLIYPADRAVEVLQSYREFTSTVPDNLTCYAVLGTSPDGKPVAVIAALFDGPIDEGERLLKPLRSFGPPLADLIAPMPYSQMQHMFDASYPPGNYNYWKSNFLTGLSDEAIGTIVKRYSARPNLMCHAAFEHHGGAISRVDPEATAYSQRGSPYNLLILGVWNNAAEGDSCIKWARDFWDAIQPFSSGGVYVNYLGREGDEGAERIRAAYGDNKFERLVELKNKYDPKNLFRFNQNIKPTV